MKLPCDISQCKLRKLIMLTCDFQPQTAIISQVTEINSKHNCQSLVYFDLYLF